MTCPEITEKSREGVAYHEAGHIVVAVVLGFKLETEGMRMDLCGLGVSYYHKAQSESGPTREDHVKRLITSVCAGQAAQRLFHRGCSDKYAEGDRDYINDLLKGFYGEAQSANAKQALRECEQKAGEIVEAKRQVTNALAQALWKKPTSPMDSKLCWGSSSTLEKFLSYSEIAEILKKHGLDVELHKKEIAD